MEQKSYLEELNRFNHLINETRQETQENISRRKKRKLKREERSKKQWPK